MSNFDLIKGDNLQAFDGQPITINLVNYKNFKISKAQFVVNRGDIVKEFNNPIFPLKIELNEQDTIKLKFKNSGRLILFDELGRKKTCDGELLFTAGEKIY